MNCKNGNHSCNSCGEKKCGNKYTTCHNADVVEVRHGYWETIAEATPHLIVCTHTCSVCKTSYKDLISKGHNYCHNCGAKMDGERRANNER